MKAKKEITLAIIIGLMVGLVVVGGIIRARSAIQNITPPTLNSARNSTDSTPHNQSNADSAEPTIFLTLTTPDNQVLTQDTLLIEGTTLPDTYIVILSEANEYIIVPNDLGQFSQEIKLTTGANTIKVTTYQTDGTNTESTLNAVYTTAEI